MPRAQFRDTVMLRGTKNVLTVPPPTTPATVTLFDTGTSNPISDTIYADSSSPATLPSRVGAGRPRSSQNAGGKLSSGSSPSTQVNCSRITCWR